MAKNAKGQSHSRLLKNLARGIIGFNVLIILTAMLFLVGSLHGSTVFAAPTNAQGDTVTADTTTTGPGGLQALAAALSTGLATVGAGLAVGMTASAALGTIAERPESFGRALIFVGLAEGIAIYGLIVSFLILNS